MYKHVVEFVQWLISIYIYGSAGILPSHDLQVLDIRYYLLKRNKIEHLDTYRVTLEFLNKCPMMWQKRKTKLSRPILEQWIPHQWQLKGTIWRFKLPPGKATLNNTFDLVWITESRNFQNITHRVESLYIYYMYNIYYSIYIVTIVVYNELLI